MRNLKKILYKYLSLENYLRLLQRGYFLLYNICILKFNSAYKYHYFVKRLIKKGDVILDIGANLGYYSMLFAKWTGERGQVYAVEPIAIYNKIYNEKARKFKNITLYPYALGVEEKSIELVSSIQAGYLQTGLPHVYNARTDGKLKEADLRFSAEMKIPSKLFGSLDRIDYVKCDIEGFEYIVLSDMKEIIGRCKPKIQVEVWEENEEKLTRLFYDLGYKAYKLSGHRLLSLDSTTDKIEGDYIFIHKDDKSFKL